MRRAVVLGIIMSLVTARSARAAASNGAASVLSPSLSMSPGVSTWRTLSLHVCVKDVN